ncbi:RDD family protein [Mycoplasma leonicaptivi]|uniref:RDD family protein n=1 Tax=Mycoplasma leonicaptivi TaxID=36742 RepID=UPI000486C47D|nr:RDD family protein [Mycoplasma leonicaptivi]
MYKNASLSKRFLANFLDLIIILFFFFICIVLPFLIKPQNKIIDSIFYSIITVIILILNFFYLIIPIFTKGKTLGMLLIKIKIIDSQTKDFRIKTLFLRNVFNSFLLSLPWVLTLIFFSKDSLFFNEKKQIWEIKQTLLNKIILQIIIMLLTIHFSIFTISYFMILFNKKKLGLNDILTDSRIVENKMINIMEVENDIKFVPELNTRRKFRYFSEIKNE